MATVYLPENDQTISEYNEVVEFLRPYGIRYEHWDVSGRIGPGASSKEILAAYSPEIERLKAEGGYLTADVIDVSPSTPGLDTMLAKFDKEHYHTEDEVRFTVEGSGLFHIHAGDGLVFSITVNAGDLISVPNGTRHWFNLCGEKRIRCIRLFEDISGWTPHYEQQGVHAMYQPLCMGPNYFSLKQGDGFEPVVTP
jgi:1,2-dihydroxy-3-keto-5-methylthiopentene dioxygenase